ncbi:enoyl-CoA hydratase/isomerase family protein [Sphingobium sp.]|uniref:enoyl-CoA hydratase/isomerase family protein n=1 Tax=Sphingobium sp. TaxID=1912891 RepID=UPI002BEEF96F|nr:enoyl-CoA hydratase-related protein [Sphingobium sp.]HUD94901.1 enoyl-CoA hydratase-related protein [Sphingobium sp.]
MSLVLHTSHDGIHTITLNSPQTLNAMSYELMGELLAALKEVDATLDARAIILTGNGRGFSSGAELGAMDTRMAEEGFGAGVATFMHTVCSPVVEQIRASRLPVIGAVNGPAVGGGFGLAISCHIVVAGRSAYFSLPFVPMLGLLPDMGATWFLPRFIGQARTLSMCLLGERLPAEEAVQIGLIQKVCDDAALLDEAQALAAKVAKIPESAFRELNASLKAAERNSLSEQLALEADRQGVLIEEPVFRQAVAAFLEARANRAK